MSHHYQRTPDLSDVLHRRRMTLRQYCEEQQIGSYAELVYVVGSNGMNPPTEEQWNAAFPLQIPAPTGSSPAAVAHDLEQRKAVSDEAHSKAEREGTRPLDRTDLDAVAEVLYGNSTEAESKPRKPRRKKEQASEAASTDPEDEKPE